jgi:hypothetical protein
MSNFIGKDGYSWWVGVVENTEDPLKIGRCKIRIFGWHTDNLQLLPTADLPWAMPKVGTNDSGSFSVPIPGDYVTGYFADGASGQNAYYDSVLPGIQAQAPDTTKGFSPQPLVPGNKAEPNAPVLPNGVKANEIGQPTTIPIARGIVANTGISITNSQLSHVCDFRYAFDFNIGLAGLTNPVTAIQNAIKNGKNNAANLIAMMIKKLNDTFRDAIKAIIAAMGLDPSGQLSAVYAALKFKLQDINDFIEKVAYYVEIAATIKFLVDDIQQIVTYLQNLPARLKAIAQDCIATFLKGAKAFGAQVAAIPGQVGSTVNGIANELQTSADIILSGLNTDVASITVPTSISSIISAPSTDHADLVTTYFNTTYANTETTLAQSTADVFDPTKMKWA